MFCHCDCDLHTFTCKSFLLAASTYDITSFLVPAASSESETAEPSCELVARAQKLGTESERSWALSQACGHYRRRCPPSELGKESCVRIMGESCSARVLQCSLLSTMQNLEPATQTRTQGEGTRGVRV